MTSRYDEISSFAEISLCSVADQRDTSIRFDVISNTSSTVVIGSVRNCCDWLSAAAYHVINSVFVDFILTLASIVSLYMVIIGLKSLTSCPVEPNIPVYLAVEGGFGLLELLSLQWRRRKKSRGESGSGGGGGVSGDVISATASTTFSDVVVVSFLCAWLACGTYWTARVYRPLFVPTPEEPSRWCTETVYVLALVQIVSCYVASSVAAAVGIVMLVCRLYRELVL